MNRTLTRTLAILGVAITIMGCSSSGSISPAPSAGPSLPTGFPIGSWTTTITAADLEAGGLSEPAAWPENSGVFTLEMAPDGTWTTTQESDAELKWPVFRGTWQATGDSTFRQTTTFPADFAGEVVDFVWRVENGNLVLELPEPPDPVLPIVMESHPWQPVR